MPCSSSLATAQSPGSAYLQYPVVGLPSVLYSDDSLLDPVRPRDRAESIMLPDVNTPHENTGSPHQRRRQSSPLSTLERSFLENSRRKALNEVTKTRSRCHAGKEFLGYLSFHGILSKKA